jgi:hypothetical protein
VFQSGAVPAASNPVGQQNRLQFRCPCLASSLEHSNLKTTNNQATKIRTQKLLGCGVIYAFQKGELGVCLEQTQFIT